MIIINRNIKLADNEAQITPIRAQGPGGQNVNKVASAVHLRFDIGASSLPPALKQKLLCQPDHRVNKAGVFVIKASEFRRQEKNRNAALARLVQFIRQAMLTRKPRIATRPSQRARQKRLDNKTRRGRTKALRGKI